MKRYEEVEMYEKKIFRAKEQIAFLKGTLEAVDTAIQLKKQKLDEDIAEYNKRANREQKILDKYNTNIAEWTKKLDKLLTKTIKSIDKEKVEVIVEKTEKEIRKDALKAKKRALAEELKKAKDQLELIAVAQELEKEVPEIIPEPEPSVIVEVEADEIVEAIEAEEPKADPSKVECPECKEWYTKGGAFASHYKSHFNGE